MSNAEPVYIPLEKQLELHVRHAQEAVYAVAEHLFTRAEWLESLSRERLEDPGFIVYGDKSFREPDSKLVRGCDEELADAINYQIPRIARVKGTLALPVEL